MNKAADSNALKALTVKCAHYECKTNGITMSRWTECCSEQMKTAYNTKSDWTDCTTNAETVP